MYNSFYWGALTAIIKMGKVVDDDVSLYEELLDHGKEFIEDSLSNGDYFCQIVMLEGLNAKNPLEGAPAGRYSSPEAFAVLEKEGPKHRYRNGCFSDGILGLWIARMCGIGEINL